MLAVSVLDRAAATTALKPRHLKAIAVDRNKEVMAETLAAVLIALKMSPAESEFDCGVRDIVFKMYQGPGSKTKEFWDMIVQAEFRLFRRLQYCVAVPTSFDLAARLSLDICQAAQLVDSNWPGLMRGCLTAPMPELERLESRYSLLVSYLVELGLVHAPTEVYRNNSPPLVLALAALHLALFAFGEPIGRCVKILETKKHELLQPCHVESVGLLARELYLLWSSAPSDSVVLKKWRTRETNLGGSLPPAPTTYPDGLEHPAQGNDRFAHEPSQQPQEQQQHSLSVKHSLPPPEFTTPERRRDLLRNDSTTKLMSESASHMSALNWDGLDQKRCASQTVTPGVTDDDLNVVERPLLPVDALCCDKLDVPWNHKVTEETLPKLSSCDIQSFSPQRLGSDSGLKAVMMTQTLAELICAVVKQPEESTCDVWLSLPSIVDNGAGVRQRRRFKSGAVKTLNGLRGYTAEFSNSTAARQSSEQLALDPGNDMTCASRKRRADILSLPDVGPMIGEPQISSCPSLALPAPFGAAGLLKRRRTSCQEVKRESQCMPCLMEARECYHLSC